MQGNPALGPGLLAMVAFVAMAGSEAGFYPSLWYGIALLTLALLVATVVAVGIPRDVPRTILAGVLLMAGFAAWQYLSITWAGENGQALDGANRTLFYATVLALFAFWPWNPRGARLVLGTFGLGISAIAAGPAPEVPVRPAALPQRRPLLRARGLHQRQRGHVGHRPPSRACTWPRRARWRR